MKKIIVLITVVVIVFGGFLFANYLKEQENQEKSHKIYLAKKNQEFNDNYKLPTEILNKIKNSNENVAGLSWGISPDEITNRKISFLNTHREGYRVYADNSIDESIGTRTLFFYDNVLVKVRIYLPKINLNSEFENELGKKYKLISHSKENGLKIFESEHTRVSAKFYGLDGYDFVNKDFSNYLMQKEKNNNENKAKKLLN